MPNESLIEGLVQDDPESIDQFGECENCVVTDWRGSPEEILGAVTDFLPAEYWSFAEKDHRWEITAGKRPAVMVTYNPKAQEAFLLQLNQILNPDFQMLRYRPVDGDGYSLYLRAGSWWNAFKADHPGTFEKYFETIDKLASTSSKGFFARLFSGK